MVESTLQGPGLAALDDAERRSHRGVGLLLVFDRRREIDWQVGRRTRSKEIS